MAFNEKPNLEGQNEESENEDQVLESETQTGDESEEQGESAAEESVEGATTSKFDSRLAALEDQLRRSNEDRDTLRESLRLTQTLAERQTRTEKPVKTYSDEQKALKDLGLAFGDDIQGAMEPLVGTVSKLFDSNDAVSFQLEMSRLNPDLMRGDKFDKLAQTVEAVRQQYARSTGQYLPRMDAYKYAKGSGMLDNVLTVTAAREDDNAAELKRQSEVKQAGNGIKTTSKNKGNDTDGGVEIQKIRDKAGRGERLTQKERAKFRDYLGDKPF